MKGHGLGDLSMMWENKTNYLASGVFSFGKILENFNLKNMISTYAKDFTSKNMT